MPTPPPPGVKGIGEPFDPQLEGHWRTTGNVRLRVGRFGCAVLEEEVQATFNERRVGEGYSPAQRKTYTKWRRAKKGLVYPITEAAT